MKRIRWTVAATLLAAHSALAGLVLDAVTRRGDRITDRSRISVVPGQILIEVDQGNNRYAPVLLYRAASEELIVFDAEKRQYMTLTASQLRGLARQMKGMLEMLPAEVRQMAGPMGEGPPQIEARKLEASRKIGDRNCDGYRIFQNGAPVMELWTVPLSEIGATDAEIRTYRDFLKMAADMAAAMPGSVGQSDAALLGLNRVAGAPIQMRKLDGSGEITDVRFRKQDLGAKRFEPPSDYTRTQLPIPGLGP